MHSSHSKRIPEAHLVVDRDAAAGEGRTSPEGAVGHEMSGKSVEQRMEHATGARTLRHRYEFARQFDQNRVTDVKLTLHVLCLIPTVVNVDLAVERVGPGARAPLARYRHHIPLIQRGERSEANLNSHSEESADMWNCTHIQVQCTSTTMQAYYKVIHCRAV